MGYIRSNHDAGKATILLMHDHSDKHNMVDALDDLLAKLKKEGYLISRPLDENVPPVQQIPSQDKNNS
jgi:peptidoglycan/xylan/chitin deacetylase (PgdA/CDA1 family)